MPAEIDSVIICDAATVREGLLHVLGGGVTRLWRPELPAVLAVQVAIFVAYTQPDFGVPHDISLQLYDPAGADFAGARGGFIPADPGRLEIGETMLFPMVFDFRNYSVLAYGKHSLKVSVSRSESVMNRDFWVLHPDELLIPPLPGLT